MHNLTAYFRCCSNRVCDENHEGLANETWSDQVPQLPGKAPRTNVQCTVLFMQELLSAPRRTWSDVLGLLGIERGLARAIYPGFRLGLLEYGDNLQYVCATNYTLTSLSAPEMPSAFPLIPSSLSPRFSFALPSIPKTSVRIPLM